VAGRPHALEDEPVSALVEASRLGLPGRLFDVCVELRPGEITCLIGPNGSGKTSLIHALAGIGSPLGSVRIHGVDVRRIPALTRPGFLSFMPASRDIRWPLIARDLIALGGADAARIEYWTGKLSLFEFAARRVDRLSTGERSRVLLARALSSEPKLLLLDEPLANLDPEWQLRLIDLLRSEVRHRAQAALVAVHDLDSAARLADRLIVMQHGGIAADGAPAEVLASEVVPQVFGIERANDRWRLAATPRAPRSSP
jgi:iron complex transport system ATP-binding protein